MFGPTKTNGKALHNLPVILVQILAIGKDSLER
jgi:hypothetical protein